MKTRIKFTGFKHDLKCWVSFFESVRLGLKPFEVRKNDRDFRPGDTLLLREFDNTSNTCTGRTLEFVIGYVIDDRSVAMAPGYCVFGLLKPEEVERS